MFRIDNPSAVPSLPLVPPPGTPGFFTNGNPDTGLAPTHVDDWFLNMLQEEILTVVTKAGLIPNKADNTQLWQAIMALQPRQTLTAAQTNYYVDPVNGSDSNNGLSAGTAWRTLQFAANWIVERLDFNNNQVIINLAAGTHAAFVQSGNPLGCFGPSQLRYRGNLANPSSVIITTNVTGWSAAHFTQNAQAVIEGVTLNTTGTITNCVGADNAGDVWIGNVIFGPCAGSHMIANPGGTIYLNSPYTISGGAQNHYFALGGYISSQSSTPTFQITLTGTPAFSSAFITAQSNGSAGIWSNIATFNGAATGTRYVAQVGGHIYTSGGGQNYFPGSVAGVVDASTYGVYQG